MLRFGQHATGHWSNSYSPCRDYMGRDINCPKLQSSDIKLQTYSQQEIPLMG